MIVVSGEGSTLFSYFGDLEQTQHQNPVVRFRMDSALPGTERHARELYRPFMPHHIELFLDLMQQPNLCWPHNSPALTDELDVLAAHLGAHFTMEDDTYSALASKQQVATRLHLNDQEAAFYLEQAMFFAQAGPYLLQVKLLDAASDEAQVGIVGKLTDAGVSALQMALRESARTENRIRAEYGVQS